MSAYLYKIKCLTNLHVGSSEAGFGVIDKSVARDAATERPVIHASGVKGALRQFFESLEASGELPEAPIDQWFGAEVRGNQESKPGELTFLPADLLALTVRANEGPSPYALVTTRCMLKLHNQRAEALGLPKISIEGIEKDKRYRFCEDTIAAEGIVIENQLGAEHPVVKGIGEEPELVVIVTEEDFREIRLPVVARNNLSEKRNLWFEEFVPHQSVFVFAVLGEKALLDSFDQGISNRVVQFGANASVGFGLTRMTRMGG